MSSDPSPGLRERKRRRTADAITQAAVRLFDERGYDDVTVAEIAAAAEVGQRTLYRYFVNKEDFLFADESELHEALARGASDVPEDTPALHVVIQAAATGIPLIQDQREALVRRARIIAATPALQTRDRLKQAALADLFVAELIRRGASPQSARLTAGVGVSLIGEAITRWLEGSSEATLAEAMKRVLADFEAMQG